MTFKELQYLWYSDLYRYEGEVATKIFLQKLIFDPGYKTSFLLRLSKYLKSKKPLIPFFYLTFFILRHYQLKYGIEISVNAQVGSGLFISHFGNIFINRYSVIGRNCNLSCGVTIGQVNRGKRKGSPVIGDNVYIGPGAKVIGAIKVGDNVAIGANCVVTQDIPDNAVVVGIPGKVISYGGVEGYVEHTDY